MQFNKPNLENLQNYMNQQNQGGSDINWWSFPSGTSSIRVLPPWDPTGRLALGVYSHRIEYKAPDSNFTKYSWTCVHRTFGKPCNICAGLERLREAGVSIDDYLPNTVTYYINALVMFDPAYDNASKMGRDTAGTMAPYTHVLMRVPKTVYTWIVNQITSPLIGDITDPIQGIDIIVTKEGTGLSTKYSTTLSPQGKTSIPNEVLEKLELYNLDEVFGQGFEDDRVNPMVESLNRSATVMRQGIPQTQQSMGGIPNYGQVPPQGYGMQQPQYNPVPPAVPQPQYTPVQQSQTVPPSQYGGTVSQQPPQVSQPPQQPNTYQAPTSPTPPVNPVQQAPQPPQMPQQTNGVNYPKCYGQYNPSSVNCVVCGYEVECSQKGR